MMDPVSSWRCVRRDHPEHHDLRLRETLPDPHDFCFRHGVPRDEHWWAAGDIALDPDIAVVSFQVVFRVRSLERDLNLLSPIVRRLRRKSDRPVRDPYGSLVDDDSSLQLQLRQQTEVGRRRAVQSRSLATDHGVRELHEDLRIRVECQSTEQRRRAFVLLRRIFFRRRYVSAILVRKAGENDFLNASWRQAYPECVFETAACLNGHFARDTHDGEWADPKDLEWQRLRRPA